MFKDMFEKSPAITLKTVSGKSDKSSLQNSVSDVALFGSQAGNLGITALDPRILLDAAGFATGAEGFADALQEQHISASVDALFAGDLSAQSNQTYDSFELSSALEQLDAQNALEAAQNYLIVPQAKDESFGISGASGDANAPVFASAVSDDAGLGTDIDLGAALITAPQNTVVFIDAGIENYDSLIADIDPAYQIVVIEAGQSGLSVMNDALEGRSDIDAVHILSHGTNGTLSLGTDTISAESISGDHALALAQIGSQLTQGGDILIYGCDFGQDSAAIDALAAVTGADIAASDDLTGAAALGGDWDLEVSLGYVEASTLAITAFDGVLADAAANLDVPATNQGGSVSSVTGTMPDGTTFTITRVDPADNSTPINIRQNTNTGNAAVTTSGGTNFGAGGTDPALTASTEFFSFDARDSSSNTLAATPVKFLITFNTPQTGAVLNFSGTANRSVVTNVASTLVDSTIYQDFNGDAAVSSITNGFQITGDHTVDLANAALRLDGSVSSVLVTINEIADITLTQGPTAGSVDSAGLVVSGLNTQPVLNEAPTLDLDVNSAVSIPGQNGFTSLVFGTDPVIFNDGQSELGDGVGNGETARYANVGTIDGQSIDVVATVVRFITDTNEFSSPGANNGDNPLISRNGTDAQVTLGNAYTGSDNDGTVEIRWDVVQSGTDIPVVGNFSIVVSDIDATNSTIGEEVAVRTDSLDSFVIGEGLATVDQADVGPGSDIVVDTAQGVQIFDADDNPAGFSETGIIRFRALDVNSNNPAAQGASQANSVQLNFTNTSSYSLIFHRDGQSGGFRMNGSFGSAPFDSPVLVDTNPEFANVYTEGETPVAIAANTIQISDDFDSIDSATIVITNAQTDDLISVTGTLPAGITATVNSDTSITLNGNATADEYEQAILAITFENSSTTPNDTVIREIEITVTDDETQASNTATSYMQVIDIPIDTDDDGVADVDDVDDDNDGILDVDEGLGGTYIGQFNYNVDQFSTDGVIGFASAVFELDGMEILTGQSSDHEDGDRSPLLSVGDVVTYSMNDGEMILAITINSLSDGSEIGLKYRDAGGNPNFELRGVETDGEDLSLSAEERAGLSFQFYKSDDAAFSGLSDLGAIAQIIAAGNGSAVQATASIRISDIDLDGRTEGVAASLDSLASYTIEGNEGTFTPVEEDGFVVLRGTEKDPSDNVQLNFLNTNIFEIDLLNNSNDRAGFSFNFSQFSFDVPVTTTTGLDSDGDGLADHMDIDSDNDGITDNIEAQSTANYIAPNADNAQTLADNNGLNSAYIVSNGLEAVDSDADGLADYIDTNSDGHADSDTLEAGLLGGPILSVASDATTDADGDGLFDVFDGQNLTAIDDGFDVNESIDLGALAYPDGDNDAALGAPLVSDVDFRDNSVPPILDLNSTASAIDTNRGFSTEFSSGSDGVSLVDLDADALEGTAVEGFTELTITLTSDFPDGANEILEIAGVDIALDADNVQSNVTIPGTSTLVDISYRDGVVSVREVSNGVISNADMDSLIRSAAYRNDASLPSDANDRSFDFQLAQYDPASFIIDFEELTPGTYATPEQIGSDPWWAQVSSQNGQIQDADNPGIWNQTLASNADGTYLFHQTGGNVPNDQRIVFGRENISVEANQDYLVSIDVGRQNIHSAGPFQVLINGSSIGQINVNSGIVGDWQTLSFEFNSGGATEVDLQLRNMSTNGTGNDFGIDNIIFERDPLIFSNIATSTVSILPVSPPLAQDDNFTIYENPEGAEIGLITNGNLLTDNGNGADSDPNGDPLSITQINSVDITDAEQISLPSGALLTIHTDGTFAYDPNGAFDSLDTDETAVDTFTYTLSDGTTAATDSATVTITISGDNDTPTVDLNGPDIAGTDYSGVFVEDEPGQPLANLLSFDAVVQDDEDNIAQINIIPSLPIQNDGADEFLRVDSEGINLSINLFSEEIIASTPLVFGNTTFVVTYTAGQISITNANSGTFDSDDLEGFLRLLAYENVNQNNSVGVRAFNFQVIDPAGLTVATSSITVERENDAPVPAVSATSNGTVAEIGSSASAEPILIVTPESAALSDNLTEVDVLERLANGETAAELGLISVADLLEQLDIADAEQNEFGIGIISADESQGAWQYLRTDVPNHIWTDFQLEDLENTDPTPVPDGHALLMGSDAILRFLPNTGFTGGAELDFRVWDGSVGTASNPPSSVVDDSGGAAPTNTSSLSTTAFTISLAADTDGDGILNVDDIDDDNDGILDVIESVEGVTFDMNGVFVTSAIYDAAGENLIEPENTPFVFVGPNLYQSFAQGTFGTATAPMDDGDASTTETVSPLNNPYPGLVVNPSGNSLDSFYAQYEPRPNGSGSQSSPSAGEFSVVANIDEAGTRNRSQAYPVVDPVYGREGFFFTADPDFTSPPVLTDTLTGLNPGQTYQYSLWAANPEDGDPNSLSVEIGDPNGPLTEVFNTGGLPRAGSGATNFGLTGTDSGVAWNQYSFVFVAPSSGEIQIDLVPSGISNQGNDIFIDNIELHLVSVDTDGDGIGDTIDIDSDDDGITDNIEAQTTDGYIAPTGTGSGITDVNEDGLDDAYDSRSLLNGGAGLAHGDSAATTVETLVSPVDTDSLSTADYLDPDSDNDGISDANENGLGVTYTSVDTDGDGLADVYEAALDGNVNDGFIVNEAILPLDGTLPDSDGDVASATPLINDLDYRDVPIPPIAQDNDEIGDEDTVLSGNVITDTDATDGTDDPVDGDALTVTEVNGTTIMTGSVITLPSGALLTMNSDGSYDYDPNGQFDNLQLGGSTTDSFSYMIDDGFGGTDVATVNITINGVNDAPLAQNDAEVTDEDSVLSDSVLPDNGNGADSDPEADSLVVTHINGTAIISGMAITLPSGAFLTMNDDGTYDYDPNGQFEGLQVGESTADSFTYQISDGQGGLSNAVVQITVNGVNDAPDALDDNEVTDATTSFSDNVLTANGNGADSDPEGDALMVTAINAVASAVGSQITLPSGALMTLYQDGSYDYDPNGQFEGLAVGQMASDSFTYTISDGNGGADTATVSITIAGVNESPIAEDDFEQTGENTTIFENVFTDNNNDPTPGNSLDRDPDGDSFVVTEVNGAPIISGGIISLPSGALLTMSANGEYFYNTNNQFDNLQVGETLTDSYTYTIDDGNGGTATATVSVTIMGVNDQPNAENNAESVNADSILSDNMITDIDPVHGVDSDVEDDTLTITAINGAPILDGQSIALPSGALLTINDSGAYSYDPNGVYDALGMGESATDSFTYVVSDGNGGIDGAVVNITINGVNDPVTPTIPGNPNPPVDPQNYIPTQTAVDGSPVTTIDLTPYFTDADVNDTIMLTINAADLPAGLSFDGANISGTPDADASQGGVNGIYTIPVTATDGNGSSFTTNVIYTVTNPAPIAIDNARVTQEHGAPVSGNVITDIDPIKGTDNDPDGDDLSVSSIDGTPVTAAMPGVIVGTYGTLTQNSDGSYSYAVDDANSAVNALAVGESLTETFTYTLNDSEGGTDVADLVITIDGENDPITPQIPGDPNVPADRTNFIPQQAGIDNLAPTPLDLNTFFTDPDASDLVRFSAAPADLPAGLTLVNGVISGMLDNSASQGGANGVYDIPVTVTDSNGDTFVTTVTYIVTNPAPTAQDDAITATEDVGTTGSVFANNGMGIDSDPDGDVIIVSQVGGDPAQVGTAVAGSNGGLFTINPDGTYEFDPNGDFEGLDAGETATSTITYQMSDGEGGTSDATVTVTVNGVNDAPIVTGTLTGQPGADSVTQTPLDTSVVFDDVDGEALSFTSSDIPSWMTLNPATGIITGTPPADASQGGSNSDGVYVVTVTATDPDGESISTPVTYTFTNLPPIIDVPVVAETAVDGEVISILPDFSDPDGDMLSYSAAGLPTGLTINSMTGEITGTRENSASQQGPNSDGIYTISVTADDGEGGTVTDTFTLTVTNPVPVAEDDALSADEDNAITGTVFGDNGNSIDQDPDGDDITVSEVGGVPANVGTAVAGSNGGLFTINPDGTYTFDPNGEFEGLDAGESATSTITYQISDGEGGTDLATVTVTVDGVNDAPEPQVPGDPNSPADDQDYIPAQSGNDSETLTPFDVSSYFDDPDGEVNFFSSPNIPTWMTLNPFTGDITGTPPADASQGGPNSDGTYPITITATDPDGESFSTVVNYVIANPAPEAFDDTEVTDEDTVLSDSVFTENGGGVDFDVDGDVISVAEVNGTPITTGSVITLPSGALLTMNDDGSYDYDPNRQFEGLAVGESASDSFTYTISDGEGGTDVATVNITVEGVNDAPIPVDPTQPMGPIDPNQPVDPNDPHIAPIDPQDYIPAQTGEDGVTATPLDLTPYFGDPDASDGVTLSIEPSDLPQGLSFDPLTNQITGTPDANASQNGDPGMPGVYTIPVTATDPSGETFTTNVTYMITNPPPVAQDDVLSGDEDSVVTFSLFDANGNMNDVDPDGDIITVTRVEAGTDVALLGTLLDGDGIGSPIAGSNGGLFIVNADGTLNFDPNKDFEDLGAGESRLTEIVYQIDDGQGGTDMANVSYRVEGVNDAPIPIDPTQPTGPLDPNDPVDLSDPHVPPVDPENYIPEQTANDSEAITALDLTPYFGDPDASDDVNLSIDPLDLPEGLTFDSLTNMISGTPVSDASQGGDPNNPGHYTIAVTATDMSGAEFTTHVSYVVSNPTPIAENDSYATPEDTPINVNIIAENDTDIDGDVLTIDAVALPDGTIIEIGVPSQIEQGLLTVNSDGSTYFEPALNYSGQLVFGYTVTDSQGGTDVATVTFDVTPVNDTPIPVDPKQPTVPTDPRDPDVPDYPTDPEDPREPPLDPENYIPEQIGSDGESVSELNLIPYFGDPDSGDVLTLSLDESDLPSGLSFDPLTGIISGTLDANASQGGDDGVYLITVTATDLDGRSFTTFVTYAISNPPPVAVEDGVLAVTEDTLTILSPLDNDTDPDGDNLTLTQINEMPVTVGVPVTLPSGAIVTLNADNTISYDPVLNYNGPDSFTYTIDDSEGGTDVAMVILDVTPVNDPPSVTPVSPGEPALLPQHDQDGDKIEVDVSGPFSDIDADDLSFTASGLPNGLSIDPETGIITGTIPPGTSANGPFDVTITATDPDGQFVLTRFVWTVDNIPPISKGLADVSFNDAAQISYGTADGFEDPDGDGLTYSAHGLPLGLMIDPQTGIISGTLERSASVDGPYDVRVTATDAQGAHVDETFTLNVLNPAPIIEPISPDPVIVGETVTIDMGNVTTDPDGDELVYSVSDLPPGLSMNPDTGIISGVPTTPQNDPYVFTVTVDDGEGGVTISTITLQVNEDGYVPPYVTPSIDALHSSVDLKGRGYSYPDAYARLFQDDVDDGLRDMLGMTDREFWGNMHAFNISEYDGCAFIGVEAVVYDHAVYVSLTETLSMTCTAKIVSWDVDYERMGGALPAWIDYAPGSDMVVMNRIAIDETVVLHIRAMLENGRTVSVTAEIDLATGTVEPVSPYGSRVATLSEQIQMEHAREAANGSELVMALSG